MDIKSVLLLVVLRNASRRAVVGMYIVWCEPWIVKKAIEEPPKQAMDFNDGRCRCMVYQLMMEKYAYITKHG